MSTNGVNSRLNTIKERIKTEDCTEEFIQNAQQKEKETLKI